MRKSLLFPVTAALVLLAACQKQASFERAKQEAKPGIPLSGSVALTFGDDPIGSQSIYYESKIDEWGQRTYSLGNTFEFTIQVKNRS